MRPSGGRPRTAAGVLLLVMPRPFERWTAARRLAYFGTLMMRVASAPPATFDLGRGSDARVSFRFDDGGVVKVDALGLAVSLKSEEMVREMAAANARPALDRARAEGAELARHAEAEKKSAQGAAAASTRWADENRNGKGIVRERWIDWQRGGTIYSSKAKFYEALWADLELAPLIPRDRKALDRWLKKWDGIREELLASDVPNARHRGCAA